MYKKRKLDLEKDEELKEHRASQHMHLGSKSHVYSNSTISTRPRNTTDSYYSTDNTLTAQNPEPAHGTTYNAELNETADVTNINSHGITMPMQTNATTMGYETANGTNNGYNGYHQTMNGMETNNGNGVYYTQNGMGMGYNGHNGYYNSQPQQQQIQMGIIVNNHYHQGHNKQNHRRGLTTELAKDVDLPEDTPLDDDPEGTLNTFKSRQKWANKRKKPGRIETMGAIEENQDDANSEDGTGTGTGSDVRHNYGDMALPQQAHTPISPDDAYNDNGKGTETDTEEDMYDDNQNGPYGGYHNGQTRR